MVKRFYLLKNRKLFIENLVNKFEKNEVFKQLIRETNVVFFDNNKETIIDCIMETKEDAIKNFFRRSKLYLDIFDNNQIDDNYYYNLYIESFSKMNYNFYYYAAIDIGFSKKRITLNSFNINKFTKPELDKVFQNDINEIFFPWAVIDTDILKNYFIISTNFDNLSKYDFEIDYDERRLHKIKNSLNFNLPLNAHLILPILRMMVLFDWRRNEAYFNEYPGLKEEEIPLIQFSIPFFYTTEDSLLITPQKFKLFMTHFYELKIYESIQILKLDDNETKAFVEFIHKMDKLYLNLKNFDKKEIFVLEKAMDYYVKAFFSQGLEEILWYIACIEALLGDKGDKEKGIIKGITDRINGILSQNKKEKIENEKFFKELYDFRSKMVHGKLIKKFREYKHFHNARKFARIAIIWYLNLLNQINQMTEKQYDKENIKKIKMNEFVYLIDYFISTKGKFNFFLNDLPEGFPYIEDWIK